MAWTPPDELPDRLAPVVSINRKRPLPRPIPPVYEAEGTLRHDDQTIKLGFERIAQIRKQLSARHGGPE